MGIYYTCSVCGQTEKGMWPCNCPQESAAKVIALKRGALILNVAEAYDGYSNCLYELLKLPNGKLTMIETCLGCDNEGCAHIHERHPAYFLVRTSGEHAGFLVIINAQKQFTVKLADFDVEHDPEVLTWKETDDSIDRLLESDYTFVLDL